MIFSIGQNGLSFFNKSFDLIKTDRANGFNLFGSLFSKNPFGIPQSELQVLGTALDDVKNNVLTVDEAFNTMLADCTDATKAAFEEFATAGKGSDALTAGLRSAGSAAGFAKVGISALNMALSALTAMAIQFAIQAAIKGIDQLVNGAHNASVAMKETAEKSIESVNKTAKEVDSLDELIAKYDELAKSGIKDADTRAQVRDIQNEINGLVGSEAGQIDLVNGSYQTQLDILQKIRAEKAGQAKDEAVAAYHAAKNAADNVTGDSTSGPRGWVKGWAYSGKAERDAEQALRDAGYTHLIEREYGFSGEKLLIRDNMDKDFNLITDAKGKVDLINDLIHVLEDAGQMQTDLYSGLIEQRGKYQQQIDTQNSALDSLLQKTIDTHRDFNYELKGEAGKTADGFNDYRRELLNSVLSDQALVEAIESGDLTFDSVNQAIIGALSTSNTLSKGYDAYKLSSDRSKILANLTKNGNRAIDSSLSSYVNSLEGEDLDIALRLSLDPDSKHQTEEDFKAAIETMKLIPENAKISFEDFYSGDTIKDNFDPILKRFQDAQSAITALENGTSSVEDLLVEHPEWSDFGGSDMQAYLKKYASDAKKAAEEAYAEARKNIATEDLAAYDTYVAAALKQYETSETLHLGVDIDVETKDMDVVINSIKSSVSQLGLNNEQIAQLKSRYRDIAGYFPDKLFERTTNGIHLNTDALMELESAYENQKKVDMQSNLAELQQQYADLTAQINEADAAGGDTSGLYKQRSAIEDQINVVIVAQSEFAALTSTYNKWKQAQSMGEEGDMFDDVQNNLKNIKELYDEGLIGTNKFKSAIELMTGKDAYGMSSAELVAAYDEAYPKMQKYFAEGTKGSEAFLEDLERIGAATRNGDQWSLDFDAEEVAKQLGVSADLVEIMARKLKDYNFDVDLAGFGSGLDAYVTNVDVGIDEIIAKKEQLQQSFKSGELTIGEYIEKWNQLDSAQKTLESIGSTDLDLDTMTIEEANAKIAELSTVIDTLSNNGLEIPVSIVGQYDELKTLLDKAGSIEDNGTTADSKPSNTEDDWQQGWRDIWNGEPAEVPAIPKPEDDWQQDWRDNVWNGEPAEVPTVPEPEDDWQQEWRDIWNGEPAEVPASIDTTGMFDDMPVVIDEPIDVPATIDTTGMFDDMPTVVDEPIDADIDARLAEDWQSAFDEQLGKIDIPEVPVEPKIDSAQTEDLQSEIDDQLPMIEFNVEPQIESKSADKVVADLQSELDENPVDITARTLVDAQSDASGSGGAFDLINIAKNAGIAKQEVTAMEAAYHDLSVAVNNVKEIDPGDTTSLQSASSGLSSAAANYMAAYNNLAAKVGEIQTVNVDANTQSALSKINALANKTVTVTVYARTIGFPTSSATGNASATGSAYAGGSAFRNGVGHVKGDGIALGGELGTETVVRDGKWFTIGDNGAEFFRYKDGDIIFNASQTEELLRTGKIRSGGGRGVVFGNDSAYADGTAFALNTNKMLTDSGGGVGVKASGSLTKSSSKSKTTSSKSSKKKSKSKSSSKETTPADASDLFDWIEVAIERVERAISNLGKTASSTFKTLATRLSASNDEISTIYKEISTQQAGAARYMQQAESVGLSSELKTLVQNGAIDLTQYDEDTKKLIEDYKNWYDKSLACSDAVQDLHENLGKLYEDRFNDVEKDFENQLSMLEHLTNTYDNSISKIEESGYLGGQAMYQQLRSVEQQNISVRKKELDGLISAMSEAVNSGEVEKYSEAWYSMQEKINDVKEAINESEIAVIKYGNSIRELNWDIFDYAQERISSISDETDFLIDLLENSILFEDGGQLTNAGQAQMGLHAVNYDVYMSQADQYAAEVKKLNAEIANDPSNTKLIERRDELLEQQREAILSAEQEKEAISDLVEEGINKELDALKDLISTYKDNLDSAKDLYEYQKKVSKQTENIASLQKQMSAYANDTSEESRARIQKLTVELSDARDSLEETQYTQYVADQKAMLDELYDAYEEQLNVRLDNIDALMADMIDCTNQNASIISQTISDQASAVGYTISNEMATILGGDGDLVKTVATYGGDMNTQMTAVNTALNGIAESVSAIVSQGNTTAEESSSEEKAETPVAVSVSAPTTQATEVSTPTVVASVESTESSKSSKKSKKSSSKSKSSKSSSTSSTSTTAKSATQNILSAIGNSISNVVKKAKPTVNSVATSLKKVFGFSDGGFVADMQKVAYRNGDNIVSFNTLKQGEAVFTEAQYASINRLIDRLPQLQGLTDSSIILKQLCSPSNNLPYTTHIDVGDINIPIDHVEDYDDLVRHMRDDKQFERFIESMTIDKINGKSGLGKKRYYS